MHEHDPYSEVCDECGRHVFVAGHDPDCPNADTDDAESADTVANDGDERHGPQIASPLFNPHAEATFDRALDTWGTEAQITKAIEENGELTAELARSYYGGNDDAVIDEIADVLIIARQVARIYSDAAVAQRVRFKMDRLRDRLDEAEADD